MKQLLAIFILIFPLAVLAENTENNANEISKHYSALPNLYQLGITFLKKCHG